MTTKLEERKIKIEIIEKALVSITLIIAIGSSGYKGYEFLSIKSKETKQRIATSEVLTKAYTESLTSIDLDIKELDKKLGETLYKGSYDWEKYLAIREAKSRDRATLLEKLGDQVVKVRQAEK